MPYSSQQGSYDEVSPGIVEPLPITQVLWWSMKLGMKNLNKQYKEPEDGTFEDSARKILEAVSGDSNIGDDEEMEPVAAIAAHLADIIS